MIFKNRLGAPESIHMRGFSPKNEQIWPRGLGCRGGATDFGGFSPCISITSVLHKDFSENQIRMLASKRAFMPASNRVHKVCVRTHP